MISWRLDRNRLEHRLAAVTETHASTPARDGFRMPGEFEPHDGTWIMWPESGNNWREAARPAQRAFVEVASAIAASEEVTVGVSERQWPNARGLLPQSVRVVELTANQSWVRDLGPTFVIDASGARRGVDWRFNGYGMHLPHHYYSVTRDDAVAGKILEYERADRYRAPIVLEGGSIHVDGEGTLITSEECLLNPNRNGDLSRQEIEESLRAYTASEVIIWLGQGALNDITSGHVDNLCCFARPGVVLISWTDDRDDPMYEICADIRNRLDASTDARGRSLDIRLLPLPPAQVRSAIEAAGIDRTPAVADWPAAGDQLTASYVNFYIANGVVVVPLLDERTDDTALSVIASAFAERKVIGIESREILLGGGNIHCITQQIPTRSTPDGARNR
jgi:agmatine deiminase